jgi:pimeloyl-ACP methyl ester carboxylesterase
VKAPVLVVHGTDDRVVPISHGRALASAGQGGDREVRWISGAGHELADHPEAGSSVAEFFARTLAT